MVTSYPAEALDKGDNLPTMAWIAYWLIQDAESESYLNRLNRHRRSGTCSSLPGAARPGLYCSTVAAGVDKPLPGRPRPVAPAGLTLALGPRTQPGAGTHWQA